MGSSVAADPATGYSVTLICLLIEPRSRKQQSHGPFQGLNARREFLTRPVGDHSIPATLHVENPDIAVHDAAIIPHTGRFPWTDEMY
jgi:hypothetical protein